MIQEREYLLRDESDTKKLADELWPELSNGGLLALNGELGSGKTTLTRYLLANAGIGRVTSPTFALMNVYQAALPVYHFDFYRVQSEDELFDIGYYEYLSEKAVMIVEWAELFPAALPARRITLSLCFMRENERKAALRVHSA